MVLLNYSLAIGKCIECIRNLNLCQQLCMIVIKFIHVHCPVFHFYSCLNLICQYLVAKQTNFTEFGFLMYTNLISYTYTIHIILLIFVV